MIFIRRFEMLHELGGEADGPDGQAQAVPQATASGQRGAIACLLFY